MTQGTDHELEQTIAIAREASKLVRSIYDTGSVEVELKGPNDPVTRADREANQLITSALAERFPGDSIVAEESAPRDAAEIGRVVAAERVWFVDPLDGTREFTERIGEFAVMIGLAVRGRAALGVVAMPTTGEIFAARVGERAFVEDATGARRDLSVSSVSDPKQATLMVSRSHRPAIAGLVVEKLGIEKMLPCGSVGVKVSRVITGVADLYVHGTKGLKRWDTCAPEAILIASGGRFTDLRGEPLDYAAPSLAQTGGIVASNALLFEAIRAVTTNAPPE